MVDRRHAVLGIEHELRVDARERGRLVRLEDVAVERALRAGCCRRRRGRRPRGLPAVRSARVTTSPASPALRIWSFRPLSSSNACFTSSEIANESCVTRTTSVGWLVAAAARLRPTSSAASTSARRLPCDRRVMRLAPSAGWRARTPRSTRDARRRRARRRSRPRGSTRARASRPRSGYARPSVVTPSAGPLHCEQRDELARLAREHALAANRRGRAPRRRARRSASSA